MGVSRWVLRGRGGHGWIRLVGFIMRGWGWLHSRILKIGRATTIGMSEILNFHHVKFFIRNDFLIGYMVKVEFM